MVLLFCAVLIALRQNGKADWDRFARPAYLTAHQFLCPQATSLVVLLPTPIRFYLDACYINKVDILLFLS